MQSIKTGKRIFISYRRDDARGASGRLYDWLRIAFGRDQVFRDVASIGPGKWRAKIDAASTKTAMARKIRFMRIPVKRDQLTSIAARWLESADSHTCEEWP